MAVRNDFAAGEVLAAADLNDTFASKVDYALPANAQTGTTYTFVLADAEKLTTASNASPVTLTIPPQSSVTWADNTVIRVVNYGAGAVTIDGGSGVTVTNTSSTIAQYGAAVAIRTASDAWTVVPFGGGDTPAAEVSSPAATGQYTDSGITYDYYTFTSSGTLTVDTEGYVDVLVISGGGGGGGGVAGQACGSGGAGGMLYTTNFLVGAGQWTVTVGGGGAGGVAGYNYGSDGSASRFGFYGPVGGGGGAPGNGGAGRNGGSGGGSGTGTGGVKNLTSGNALVPASGNNGGNSLSGGGGGAGSAGSAGSAGAGLANSITGSSVTYATGGQSTSGTPTAGAANKGDGGGGKIQAGNGAAGGSGVVIVRVKV